MTEVAWYFEGSDVEEDVDTVDAKKSSEGKDDVKAPSKQEGKSEDPLFVRRDPRSKGKVKEGKETEDASEPEPESQTSSAGGAAKTKRLTESELKAAGYVGRQDISEDAEMIQRLFGCVTMCLMQHLHPFFKKHLHLFDPDDERCRPAVPGEYDVEQYRVFQEFEQAIDDQLESFAKEEGFTNTKRLFNVIRATANKNRSSRKLVRLINRSTDFPRFLKWMEKMVQDRARGYLV